MTPYKIAGKAQKSDESVLELVRVSEGAEATAGTRRRCCEEWLKYTSARGFSRQLCPAPREASEVSGAPEYLLGTTAQPCAVGGPPARSQVTSAPFRRCCAASGSRMLRNRFLHAYYSHLCRLSTWGLPSTLARNTRRPAVRVLALLLAIRCHAHGYVVIITYHSIRLASGCDASPRHPAPPMAGSPLMSQRFNACCEERYAS